MKEVRLDKFCDFSAGGKLKLHKGHYVESGYPAFSAAGQDGFVEQWEYDRPAVVVSSIGARCGKAFLATGRWTSLANTQIVFPNIDVCLPEYLWYILNDEKSWIIRGSAQPFIKPLDIKNRQVPLPPLPRQWAIADHLDRETGRLDALAGRTRESVALLRERRAALISAAVGGR